MSVMQILVDWVTLIVMVVVVVVVPMLGMVLPFVFDKIMVNYPVNVNIIKIDLDRGKIGTLNWQYNRRMVHNVGD